MYLSVVIFTQLSYIYLYNKHRINYCYSFLSIFALSRGTHEYYLLVVILSLKNDVDDLKARDDGRTYPQKRWRDGDNGEEGSESHDGDEFENHNGDISDTGEVENDGSHDS